MNATSRHTMQMHPSFRARLVLLLCLCIALLGSCRDDDTGSNLEPLTPELEATMAQVAELRSLPPATEVRAGTVSRANTADLIVSTLTENDRESFDELTTLYRLLGHLQPEQDFLSIYREFADGAVAGFYSPPDKAFYVVSEGPLKFANFSQQQKSTTAHEFVHALQDAEFDLLALGERTRGDLDWSLALSAVIEGDAVVHEGLWSREYALAPGAGRGLLFAAPPFASVPASIEREFRFPYTAGAEWVASVRSQRGIQAINGILRGRRLTTAEILHPELYDTGWEASQVHLPDISGPLGSGWSHESGGAFGEFQLRNFLQLEIGALPAVSAATGWTGDRYDVYSNDEESVAALRVTFASPSEAEEFRIAIDEWGAASGAEVNAGTPTAAALEDGRAILYEPLGLADVLLVFGSNRTVAERAHALLAGG